MSARSGATVHLPALTRDYLEGVTPRTPRPAAIASIWPAVFDQPFDPQGAAGAARGAKIAGYATSGGMRWPTECAIEFVGDGDTLPGASDWQAIATPGHTDDSLAFWHSKTRTLMSETPFCRSMGERGSHRRPLTTPPAPKRLSVYATWMWPTCCLGTAAPSMEPASPREPGVHATDPRDPWRSLSVWLAA